jgi:hypothetical protein
MQTLDHHTVIRPTTTTHSTESIAAALASSGMAGVDYFRGAQCAHCSERDRHADNCIFNVKK